MTRFWTSLDIRLRALLIVVALAGAYVVWYLGSPLFINRTVNESFPAVSAPQPGQAADAMADSAMANKPADAMADKPADTMADSAMADKPADTMADKPADAMADKPVALSSGQFGAIDTIHKGEGKATIFKLPDGKRVLRFENFKVTNGPDLYVYLSGNSAPRSGEQVHQGGVELAQLKGNIGDQNYELPDDLDLAMIKSAVIYCKQFSVVFSTAELAMAS
jgi:hypothetical protein